MNEKWSFTTHSLRTAAVTAKRNLNRKLPIIIFRHQEVMLWLWLCFCRRRRIYPEVKTKRKHKFSMNCIALTSSGTFQPPSLYCSARVNGFNLKTSYAKGIVLFLFVLNFIMKGSLAFLKLFCLHTILDFHFLLYGFVLSTMSNTSAHLYSHLNDALSVRLLNTL